jgi:outer membrane beta-barrel protein
MTRSPKAVLAGVGLAWALPIGAFAQDEPQPPGIVALQQVHEGRKPPAPVQNRFFLKGHRFEITPMVGSSPNNPFASRFSVSLALAYHFNEVLSLELMTSYMPDLGKGDVKSLVPILLDRATDPDFEQPLDKATLFTNIGVKWAPVYGKINILGETVLNFDFYGFLGVGFVLDNNYKATENPNPDPNATSSKDLFILSSAATKPHAAPTIGVGADFFITQTIAVRIDGRFGIVIDDKLDYGVDTDSVGSRVVTLFNASAGVAFFFPKMKPRLYDF